MSDDAPPEFDPDALERVAAAAVDGTAYALGGRRVLGIRHGDLDYESMAEGLGNSELRGAFYTRMGNCEYSFGHFDKAIQTLTKAATSSHFSMSMEKAWGVAWG